MIDVFSLVYIDLLDFAFLLPSSFSFFFSFLFFF